MEGSKCMEVFADLGFRQNFQISLLKRLSAEFHHWRPISAELIVECLPQLKSKNMSADFGGIARNFGGIARSFGGIIPGLSIGYK